MVIIQSGRYGAVVTLSAYKSRGREFDPPLLHWTNKWLRDWQNEDIDTEWRQRKIQEKTLTE